MAVAKITKETYLQWYEQMLLIRRFEERAGLMYGHGIRGFLHLYIGQEAIAAGAIAAIRPEDAVITAYRDHGMAIAKGVTPKAAMAELFGKETGCAKGKGGSMHFFSKEHNFYGGHGIVGGHIPLGAGIALAEQYRGTDNVCLCFFGDGAARQGALFETFNMAMLWKLPVIFICENNHYAMGTAVERSSNVTDIYKIGSAFDMPSESVNGMKCEDVYNAVGKAVEQARKGGGPTFLEVKTYRYKGHSISDPAKYRTKEELEKYKHQDSILDVKATILKKKYATEKELAAVDKKVKEQVDEAVTFAEDSAYPDPSELFTDIYTQTDYPFLT